MPDLSVQKHFHASADGIVVPYKGLHSMTEPRQLSNLEASTVLHSLRFVLRAPSLEEAALFLRDSPLCVCISPTRAI